MDFWKNNFGSAFEEKETPEQVLDLGHIVIQTSDITKLDVEAIVNPANSTLLGGSGLDGLIHNRAGKELFQVCRKLGGCKTGEAKITEGFHLPCKYIIHTVGPQYDYDENPEELLANCYRNSAKLAYENGIRELAFPCISTGAYGYPFEPAARIAIRTILEFLKEHSDMTIHFVLYDDYDYSVYFKIYNQIKREGEL